MLSIFVSTSAKKCIVCNIKTPNSSIGIHRSLFPCVTYNFLKIEDIKRSLNKSIRYRYCCNCTFFFVSMCNTYKRMTALNNTIIYYSHKKNNIVANLYHTHRATLGYKIISCKTFAYHFLLTFPN